MIKPIPLILFKNLDTVPNIVLSAFARCITDRGKLAYQNGHAVFLLESQDRCQGFSDFCLVPDDTLYGGRWPLAQRTPLRLRCEGGFLAKQAWTFLENLESAFNLPGVRNVFPSTKWK